MTNDKGLKAQSPAKFDGELKDLGCKFFQMMAKVFIPPEAAINDCKEKISFVMNLMKTDLTILKEISFVMNPTIPKDELTNDEIIRKREALIEQLKLLADNFFEYLGYDNQCGYKMSYNVMRPIFDDVATEELRDDDPWIASFSHKFENDDDEVFRYFLGVFYRLALSITRGGVLTGKEISGLIVFKDCCKNRIRELGDIIKSYKGDIKPLEYRKEQEENLKKLLEDLINLNNE